MTCRAAPPWAESGRCALLLEGGGMRAAFVAGAVACLMDHHAGGFLSGLAVSASAPTITYFACGQRAALERVWLKDAATPAFVRYRHLVMGALWASPRWRFLDLDHMVYRVFRTHNPFALDRARFPTRIAIAHPPHNGGPPLLAFPVSGTDTSAFYPTLHGAMAVPGGWPAPVPTPLGPAVDAGVVNPLPVQEALAGDPERLLVILSKPLGTHDPLTPLHRLVLRPYLARHPWVRPSLLASSSTYATEARRLRDLARGPRPRAFVIAPTRMPLEPFLTRNAQRVREAWKSGYTACRSRLPALRRFLAT